MAKFVSHDGVDAQGIRAEVTVQTGTGRIKELNPRGKETEPGVYRNVEVVFDPDNLLLKRKVYALLDTTAKDLWAYVQAAHADQRDISFRIESQRKRTVDRTKAFKDLIHTEEVVRVLAAIDNNYSHEAKTTPREDPTGDYSALDQEKDEPTITHSTASPADANPKALVTALADARSAGLPDTTIDTLMALALAAGVPVADALSAGLSATATPDAPRTPGTNRMAATEEKPWMPYNSDGRVNAGSYMVSHASKAEQFALDHLISVYSEGKKTAVDVADTMIAQAASVAFVLLEAADAVQAQATGGRSDRQKNSYGRAFTLVADAVEKRFPVPVGGNNEAQEEWKSAVIAEAAERLYGVLEISQGRLPQPEADRGTPVEAAPAAEVTPTKVAAPVKQAATKTAAARPAETIVADLLNGTVIPSQFKTNPFPAFDTAEFIAPDDHLIGRLRDLCQTADAIKDPALLSNWLERVLGVRSTRKVHAPALDAFITHYEQAGPNQVHLEITGTAN